MPDYNLTGVGPTFLAPGTYVEVILGAGPASAGGDERKAVLVGKFTGSTLTAGTLYDVSTLQDLETAAGARSQLAQGVRRFLAVNKTTPLAVLPVAETTGGSPAQATGTITLATTATGPGTLRVICPDGEPVDVTIATGDTPTIIAAALEAALNARLTLPFTASASSGVVTLTAVHYGIAGGTATDTHIPVSATITAGIGMTVTVAQIGTVVAGAEGSTTTAANIATALATLNGVRKYYIGVLEAAADDTDTAWDNVASHVTANALPVADKRTAGFFGFRGSLTDAATLALAQNNARLHVLCQPSAVVDVPYLVGNAVGVVALEESKNASWNATGHPIPGLPVAPESSRPTPTQISSAISDGVTVIQSTDTGAHFVALVTTKSKTSSVDDDRALYAIKRGVADKFADDLQAAYAVAHAGKNIANDILRRDGTFDTTSAPPDNTLTPKFATSWVQGWVRNWHEAAGRRHLQNFEQNVALITVSRHSVVSTRLAAYVPIAAVDPLTQTTIMIPEVGRNG